MSNFNDMFEARWANGKRVCVGLDPDLEKIPAFYAGTDAERVFQFLSDIIEATHTFAAAYKPNIAFFERLGVVGPAVLSRVIHKIREIDSLIPIILDFKRGDIGNTNFGYVQVALDYGVEAITIHPFLGLEAMTPFLKSGLTAFVLCHTSNPGAGEFQHVWTKVLRHNSSFTYYADLEQYDRETGRRGVPRDFKPVEMQFYEFVAHRVHKNWSQVGSCGLVVGATYADKELRVVREIVGDDNPLLIPGIGKQGGDLAAAISNGKDSHGGGMVINNSSAILYAPLVKDPKAEPVPPESPAEVATAACQVAEKNNDDIGAALQAA